MSGRQTRKTIMSHKRTDRYGLRALLLAVAAFAVVLAGYGRPVSAASDGSYKTVGGIAAYLGVLPAEIARGRAAAHPGKPMHGGGDRGRHEYHLVVALFDEATGSRIEEAEVAARISGLGHVGSSRVKLEAMNIANTITYGGYVSLPRRDRYSIEVEIVRSKRGAPVRIEFGYEHRL
jgi:hypothetical protein